MSVGLHKIRLEDIIRNALTPSSLSRVDIEKITKAVAAAIDKNNAELEKEFNVIRNEID